MVYPAISEPTEVVKLPDVIAKPLPVSEARAVKLAYGPNITPLPKIEPLPDELDVPVLLQLGDDISTDAISPAGAEALPFRSNLIGLADFSFKRLDATYVARAKEIRGKGGHALVAGRNYGQGSSREHAALAPQFLGLRLVIAKTMARIHEQNLVNAGILPLLFDDPQDYDSLDQNDRLSVSDLRAAVKSGEPIRIRIEPKDIEILARHNMSERQIEIFLAGGLVNWFRERSN